MSRYRDNKRRRQRDDPDAKSDPGSQSPVATETPAKDFWGMLALLTIVPLTGIGIIHGQLKLPFPFDYAADLVWIVGCMLYTQGWITKR